MRTCESYIADMNLSIDGLLDEAEEQELQAHLAVCPKCRSLYQSYQDINAAILEAEVEPPKGLSHSVMEKIHQEKTKNKPKAILGRMRFTLAAAVIALAVLAAGKYLGTPGDNVSSGAAQTETAAAAEAPAAAENQAAGEAALVAPPKSGANTGQQDAEAEAAGEAETQDAGAEYMVGAAPEEAAEEPFDPATESEKAPADDTAALDAAVDALETLGYHGTLLEVSATEETVYDLLPSAQPIALENGATVYQVSEKEYQSVMDQLPSIGGAVMESEGDVDETYVYLLLK